MAVTALEPQEIEERIALWPEWCLEGDHLIKCYEFQTFRDAIGFVDRVADIAEEQKHHPDIAVSYRKVVLSLSTHSAHGVTDRDIELLQRIEEAGNQARA